MSSSRKMALTARPEPLGELRSLFTSSPNSIRRLLERPPSLRPNGWDLQTGASPETINGQYVRARNGDRKVLDLYRDGTCIFVCRADDWFLSWASPKGAQRINPLAFVEVVYSFTSFYRQVLDDLIVSPVNIRFRLDLRDMTAEEPAATLAPHALSSGAQMFDFDTRVAPANDARFERVIPALEVDPGAVAYWLVREVYRWFGFHDEAVPYVTTTDGVPTIDPATIVAGGR